VLSSLFRGLFLHYLDKAFAAGELNFFSEHRHLHEPAAFQRHLAPIYNTKWVVLTGYPDNAAALDPAECILLTAIRRWVDSYEDPMPRLCQGLERPPAHATPLSPSIP
jgi:hypothetical protein